MSAIKRASFDLAEFLPPDCAGRMEHRVAGLEGVMDVCLQPVHGRVTVEFDPARVTEAAIHERLAEAGCRCEHPPEARESHEHAGHTQHAAVAPTEAYDEHAGHAHPSAPAAAEDHTGHAADEHGAHAAPAAAMPPVDHAGHGKEEHQDHHAMMQADMRRRFIVSAVLSVPLLLLSPTIQDWFNLSIPSFTGQRFVLFALATVVVAYGAWPFFKGAARAIPSGVFDMDVLISVAVSSGYLFSVAATFWFEAVDFYWEIGTLIVVLLFGHWMEMRAIRGTTDALSELSRLLPDVATRLRDGTAEEVPTAALQTGDLMLVRSGARVPIDGDITEGESDLDESMITGESRPVTKGAGASVIGGSINGPGALQIEVTKTGDDTAISQMARLVLEAQDGKPRVQRQADLAAHWLTIVAIVVGVGTLIFWSLIAGEPFVAALTLAITVVVLACPHALGLAIPMVTTISATLAARSGMLIKSAEALEVARQVDVVVFDKTGTLTKGEFGVTGIVSADGWTDDQVLAQAAAVEATSEHPIARGILRSADERHLTYEPAANFRAIPGKGAQAEVEGELVHVVTPALMREIEVAIDGVGDAVERIAKGGTTLVYLAHQGKLRGVLVLADIVREESREAIRNLTTLGVESAMLTGGNHGSRGSRAGPVHGHRRRSARRQGRQDFSAASAGSPWWAMASTTRRPWPRPTLASRLGPEPTSPSRRPTSS